MEWQPIETAPKDGTWILGMNNRGNPAVIIWDERAHWHDGVLRPGWIHPFSRGDASTFWNGGNGSLPEYWMRIPWHPNATRAPYWASGSAPHRVPEAHYPDGNDGDSTDAQSVGRRGSD